MLTSRTINVSPAERVVRVVGGAGAVVIALLLLASGLGGWALFGAVALAAAGIDFVVTGVRGYCPLYARLGKPVRAPVNVR